MAQGENPVNLHNGQLAGPPAVETPQVPTISPIAADITLDDLAQGLGHTGAPASEDILGPQDLSPDERKLLGVFALNSINDSLSGADKSAALNDKLAIIGYEKLKELDPNLTHEEQKSDLAAANYRLNVGIHRAEAGSGQPAQMLRELAQADKEYWTPKNQVDALKGYILYNELSQQNALIVDAVLLTLDLKGLEPSEKNIEPYMSQFVELRKKYEEMKGMSGPNPIDRRLRAHGFYYVDGTYKKTT